MSGDDRLRWIPLESNPEVFNKWARRAGLATLQESFSDVYGLDPDLLALVPQPTKAVVLLFPDSAASRKRAQEEDARIAAAGGQPHLDPTVFYVRQRISNACGTIALIHALANSDVTWLPESPLQKFIVDGQDKTPEERADVLQSRTLFSDIHAESAQEGQTAPDVNTDLHFTCFVAAPDADVRKAASGGVPLESVVVTEAQVQAQVQAGDGAGAEGQAQAQVDTGMRLIELDGRRSGPVDHGVCKDLLADAAAIVRDRYLSQTESVYFNLMALGPTFQD